MGVLWEDNMRNQTGRLCMIIIFGLLRETCIPDNRIYMAYGTIQTNINTFLDEKCKYLCLDGYSPASNRDKCNETWRSSEDSAECYNKYIYGFKGIDIKLDTWSGCFNDCPYIECIWNMEIYLVNPPIGESVSANSEYVRILRLYETSYSDDPYLSTKCSIEEYRGFNSTKVSGKIIMKSYDPTKANMDLIFEDDKGRQIILTNGEYEVKYWNQLVD